MKIMIEEKAGEDYIVYENVTEFALIGTHAPEPGNVRTSFNRFLGGKFELVGKAEELKQRILDS